MFKIGDKVKETHPHTNEEVTLTITKVAEDHSLAESKDGAPFAIFHEKFTKEDLNGPKAKDTKEDKA